MLRMPGALFSSFFPLPGPGGHTRAHLHALYERLINGPPRGQLRARARGSICAAPRARRALITARLEILRVQVRYVYCAHGYRGPRRREKIYNDIMRCSGAMVSRAIIARGGASAGRLAAGFFGSEIRIQLCPMMRVSIDRVIAGSVLSG